MDDIAYAISGMFFIIVLIAIDIVIYFLPRFIAALRPHTADGMI